MGASLTAGSKHSNIPAVLALSPMFCVLVNFDKS
ncbi:hypothetical protein BH160DRAFT_2419 [Burkholderia sp. H160]|nr:hypothetical protein BH160DRAFT_2419 [Burkholderia sp. H160]